MNKQVHIPLTETVYYILLAFEQPMHGYAVMQYIAEMSDDRVQIGPGTLYGAIKTLLEKEWISLVKGEKGSRKKEYLLTEIGREVIYAEIQRLKELTQFGEKIMWGDTNEKV